MEIQICTVQNRYEMNRQKLFLATGIVTAASIAGYITVYLPFYSSLSKQRQEEIDKSPGIGAKGGGMGSMWKNIDGELKGTRHK